MMPVQQSIPRAARRRFTVLAATVLGLRGAVAVAGPNLLAIGDFGDVPYKRATEQGNDARDSFPLLGKEVVYAFREPEFDFGRIIVRSQQPRSIVRENLFVGFTGQELIVSTETRNRSARGGAGSSAPTVQVQELEIWLRINGKLRSGASYEWEMESVGGQDIQNGVPALIPALWADGEQIGAEVTIKNPQPGEDDRIRRNLLPHGVVTLKNFEQQTGGAWIVLRPAGYGAFFGLRRFAFREVDTAGPAPGAAAMPIPLRYIPIRSDIEDEIGVVLERSSAALKAARNEDGTWGEQANPERRVEITASVAGALGELDPNADEVKKAMEWLAKQAPPQGQSWGLITLAERLYTLARHGGLKQFGPVIQADVQTLVAAQGADGGWSDRATPGGSGGATVSNSTHAHSLTALTALREARFAGAEPDKRVWKEATDYWIKAQFPSGGFSHKLERWGGVGQAPTSAHTATGACGLLTCIDMSGGVGAARCSTYLGGTGQLRGAALALKWLDTNFREPLQDSGSLRGSNDPYYEPHRLERLGSVSGVARFHEKSHFEEGARTLLGHYDRTSGLFGIRRDPESFAEPPSIPRTADALSILARGAAPTVCQRIVAGDKENRWAEFRGDVQHLVRYLASKRGRQFNWRRTTIDREVRELAEAPITIVNVLGPFDWGTDQWQKIREYCLAGGSVVIDIGEEAQAQREAVLSGLKTAFPEYALADLPSDAAVLSAEKDPVKVAGLQALGNGFRHFLFIPKESWSCQWHLYQAQEHPESFVFMNHLLTYATDGTPPRSSFTSSPYAVGSVESATMKASRLQVGSDLPAYPNLIATTDRLMRSNFRLKVEEPHDPREADMLWVNVTGPRSPTEGDKDAIRGALRAGQFVLIDVVSGNVEWDKTFREMLKGIAPGVSIESLPRNHAVYTGEVPGTQGFDAVNVKLRKALHTRFAQSGRCDLYGIYVNGKEAGVYSAYDLSSGMAYHQYPGCRGVMPEHARELAMNAVLTAYEWKTRASTAQSSAVKD